MGFLAVLVAAAASYALGAVWYMALANPWMAAAGVNPQKMKEEGKGGSPVPFIIAAIAALLVAGMMRHIFGQAGITGISKGALSGLGIGAFMITPWVAMNYAYAMRPRNLTLIDGGYSILGCTLMGAVLGYFAAGAA